MSDPGTGPPPGDTGAGGAEGAEPDPTELVGTVLAGRYRVTRRLGVGAMGAVYLGEHVRIGRMDAIKVLRAAMARDPEAIARFTRGARNVSRIRHPNVCTLYDFGDTEEGFHFLAMEYVDGPTLGKLLEDEGPLPPERAAEVIAQVGEALHAAHLLGIVHRDLKPDNIMIARDAEGADRVKVVDFDIARGPAEEEGPAVTRHGFVVGTPEYMSPEQLTGDPLDGRSDVYSMALVYFRMVTGSLPFTGDTAQEIMVQRLTRAPRTLAEAAGRSFPPALEEAVGKGLQRKADERFTDARELAMAIANAAVGSAGSVGSVGAADPGAYGAGHGVGAAGPSSGATATGARPATQPVPAATPTPRSLPETKVAGAATGGHMRKRTPLLVGLGAAAAILVVGSAIVALDPLGSGGGDPDAEEVASEEGFGGGEAGGEGAEQEGAAGEGTGDVVAGAGEDGGAGETAGGGGGIGQGTDDAGGGAGGGGEAVTEGRDTGDSGAGATDETGAAAGDGVPTLGISPAEARNVVYRQYLLQGEDPDRSVLEAVRDTARAVWSLEGVSSDDRAFAAHVLGLALIPLGDSIRGVEWLEEAARLDPIERYISVRDVYRGGNR